MLFLDSRKRVFIPHEIVSDRFPTGARNIVAVVAVVIVAWILFLPSYTHSFGPGARADNKSSFVEKAPGFVLKDLDGRQFRLNDFKGKKPVLLIFGATWCGFCREEIPHFKALHAAYAKQGLEIVNIDSQESKEKVARFSAKNELPYRVLLDEDGAVAGIYDILGVPAMVLIDQKGNILCRMCQRVEPIIESLLKKK